MLCKVLSSRHAGEGGWIIGAPGVVHSLIRQNVMFTIIFTWNTWEGISGLQIAFEWTRSQFDYGGRLWLGVRVYKYNNITLKLDGICVGIP